MADGRYRLEPCEHAAYSNIRRANGTRVGDLSFHTQEGAPAVVEMNSLLDQLEEARAEAERLRGLLRPLAERFAEGMKIEHPHGYNEHGHFIPRLFEHRDGDWRGVEVARAVTFAHMRQCCAALGIEVPAP